MENTVKTTMKTRLLSLLLAGIMIFGVLSLAGCDNNEAQADLEKKLEESTKESADAIAKLEKALADAKAEYAANQAALEKALAESDKKAADELKAANDALEAAIAKAVEEAQKAWTEDWEEATKEYANSTEELNAHYVLVAGDDKATSAIPAATFYTGAAIDEIDAAYKAAEMAIARAATTEEAAKVIAGFDAVVQKWNDTEVLGKVNTKLDAVDKAIADTQKEWDETENKEELKDAKPVLSKMSKDLEEARKLFDTIEVKDVTIEVAAPTTADPDAKKTVTVADAETRLKALEAKYDTVYKAAVTVIRDNDDAKTFIEDMDDRVGKIEKAKFVTLKADEAKLDELAEEYAALTDNAKAKVEKDDKANYDKYVKYQARLADLKKARAAAGVDKDGKYPEGTINAAIAAYNAMWAETSTATLTEKQVKEETIDALIEAWKDTYFAGDYAGERDLTGDDDNVPYILDLVKLNPAKTELSNKIKDINKDGNTIAFINAVAGIKEINLLTSSKITAVANNYTDMVTSLKAKGVYDETVKLDKDGNTLKAYKAAYNAKAAIYFDFVKKATTEFLAAHDQYYALDKDETAGYAEFLLDTWFVKYGEKDVQFVQEVNDNGDKLYWDKEIKVTTKTENPVYVQKVNDNGDKLYVDPTDPTKETTEEGTTVDEVFTPNDPIYVKETIPVFKAAAYALDKDILIAAINAADNAAVVAENAAIEAYEKAHDGAKPEKTPDTDERAYATFLKGILGDYELDQAEWNGTASGAKYDVVGIKFQNTLNYIVANSKIDLEVVATIKAEAKKGNYDLATRMINAVKAVYDKYIEASAGSDNATLMKAIYDGFQNKVATKTYTKGLITDSKDAIVAIEDLK